MSALRTPRSLVAALAALLSIAACKAEDADPAGGASAGAAGKASAGSAGAGGKVGVGGASGSGGASTAGASGSVASGGNASAGAAGSIAAGSGGAPVGGASGAGAAGMPAGGAAGSSTAGAAGSSTAGAAGSSVAGAAGSSAAGAAGTSTGGSAGASASSGGAGGAPARVGGDRDLWVWGSAWLPDANEPDGLLAFCKTRQVKRVYVESQGAISKSRASLKAFVEAAASQGIEVELLFGDPAWINAPAKAVALAKDAAAFAAEMPNAKPVAVHFDVEPHALDNWKADQQKLSLAYLDLLDALREGAKPLPLRIDVGHFYTDVSVTRAGKTKSLLAFSLDAVDRATLMAYRDHASGSNGVIDIIDDDFEAAAGSSHKLAVGFETGCEAGLVAEKVTFCEAGEAKLETGLAETRAAYGKLGAFAGLAVHSYASYRGMKP